MRALTRLVMARLASRRRAGTVMIPAAVAGAVLVLLGSGVVSLMAQDATLRRALERGPKADRTVRVEVFNATASVLSLDGGNPALTDADERLVRSALPKAEGRGPIGQGVVHFDLPGFFTAPPQVIAVDDIRKRVHLRSGRLPRQCSATRCEVVVLGNGKSHGRLRSDEITLTVTGRGDLDASVLGRLPPPGTYSDFFFPRLYMVAPSFAALGKIPPLELTPRRYSVSRELDPAKVHPWTVDELTLRLRRARAQLSASQLETVLHAPDGLLAAEAARGVVAERRLLIIAGLAAAALLGFALLAATLRRRDVGAELSRLSDAGARPWQLHAFVGMEAAALALTGTLAGVVATVALTAVLGAVENGDAGLYLRESLLDGGTPALAAAAWAAATLVLAGALRGSGEEAVPLSTTGRGPNRGPLLVAAGALALLVWQAGQRGALGPAELAGGSSAPPELLILPGLLALVAALLTAAATGPLLRRLERVVRPAGVTLQLAVLSLVRRPGRTSAATGFLAAGVTLGLFALSHADALRTGARSAAAFQAGADLRVAEAPVSDGDRADVLPLARYDALPGVTTAAPALRSRAEVLSAARGIGRATLLGLPGEHVEDFPAMRDAVGLRARALAGSGGDFRLDGPAFPAGTKQLTLPVRATGAQAMMALVVEDARGRIARLSFRESPTERTAGYAVRPPRGGGRVVGFELTVIAGFTSTLPVATVAVGPLLADGREITRFAHSEWGVTPGVEAGARDGRFRFETAATTGSVGLVAKQPEAARPIPAIVSRRLAAEADRDGVLPLRLASGEVFRIKVAGTAARLPTAGGEFALVDTRRAYRALNGTRAGTIALNEMWLRTTDAAAAARAVRRPPFRDAGVISRAALTARVEADAVSRSAIGALWAAAALALAIAACGLALTVRGALTDGAHELVELEAMGVTPRELRRQLRLGAVVVGAGGAAVGAGGAAALSALFTSLVRVSADGRAPLPPLRGDVAWGLALASLAGAALLAGVWVAAVTWRAFSADAPGKLGA
jgi:hypothetical protein